MSLFEVFKVLKKSKSIDTVLDKLEFTESEKRRVKSYVEESGIDSGGIKRVGEYIGITINKCKKGSQCEAGRVARRAKASDSKHLTSVGQDKSGGSKS